MAILAYRLHAAKGIIKTVLAVAAGGTATSFLADIFTSWLHWITINRYTPYL
jgi:hypothetical protein